MTQLLIIFKTVKNMALGINKTLENRSPPFYVNWDTVFN